MKRLSLNSLQIAHQTNPCSASKCKLPDCGNCLCGKRSDTEYCCDEHKALKNNKVQKTDNFQNKLRTDLNKKNMIMIEDLYSLGYRKVDIEAMRLRGFDFSASPFPGIVNGRKVAVYGTIALWVDEKLLINLEKI